MYLVYNVFNTVHCTIYRSQWSNDEMNYQNIKLLIESQYLQPNNIVVYGQYFVAFLITFIYTYSNIALIGIFGYSRNSLMNYALVSSDNEPNL